MPIDTDCPAWEYSGIDGVKTVLLARAQSILQAIRGADSLGLEALAKDTRKAHKFCFANLTPSQCPYYAGNYRGQNYLCLRDYGVVIKADPRVGHAAETVPIEMQEFASSIDEMFRQLNLMWPANEKLFPKEWKIYRAVELAAAAFVYFLEIHPYANGNGHMARMLLIAILARFELHLARWPIEPRPPDPPYSDLIKEYRNGTRSGLEQFILSCV